MRQDAFNTKATIIQTKKPFLTLLDIYPEISSSGKILPIFMEGHSHDPVSGIESFLHTITMVDVYVNVQHPLVVPGRENRDAIQAKQTFYSRKESSHRNSNPCVLTTMLIGKFQKNRLLVTSTENRVLNLWFIG